MVVQDEPKNNAERVEQVFQKLTDNGHHEIRDFAIKELHETYRATSQDIRDAWIKATLLVLIKRGIL